MKARFGFAVLALLLFSLVGLNLVWAESGLVGVSEGDVFVYSMTAEYVSTVSNATVEVPEFEANNTDWVRIEITNINGSMVDQVYTLHYKNGTDQIIKGQTDLANNSSYMQESGGFRGVPMCPPNLTVGDSLQTFQLTINETVVWAFPNGNREVNHVFWTSDLEIGDLYFDKQTGILVDMYRQHAFINSITGEVVKKADIIKMQSSSLWTIPEFPTFLFPSLVLVTASIGLLLFKKMKNKRLTT
jgi:hypothetical protein